MIKILGFNILRDWELEKLTNKNWEKAKELFKIKKLYRISQHYEQQPKCSKCDKDRRINVELPDGSKTWVNCSCARSKITYHITYIKENLCYIIKKDKRVWLAEGLSEWAINQKIIYNEEQLKQAKDKLFCYFTTKKLAEKALKEIEELNK